MTIVSVGREASRQASRQELVDVGGRGVDDGEAVRAGRPAATFVGQVVERARPGALARLALDDTVAHLDDRLDRQQRADERLGGADPAAAAQVVEGVECPEHRRRGRGIAAIAAAILSESAPASARRAASRTSSPSPIVTESESTTLDRESGRRCLGTGERRLVGGRQVATRSSRRRRR